MLEMPLTSNQAISCDPCILFSVWLEITEYSKLVWLTALGLETHFLIRVNTPSKETWLDFSHFSYISTLASSAHHIYFWKTLSVCEEKFCQGFSLYKNKLLHCCQLEGSFWQLGFEQVDILYAQLFSNFNICQVHWNNNRNRLTNQKLQDSVGSMYEKNDYSNVSLKSRQLHYFVCLVETQKRTICFNHLFFEF